MSDANEHVLSGKRELAIRALLTGATDTKAAEDAGVTRQTLGRWRTQDAQFISELNRRRRELWDIDRGRIRDLLPKAVEALEAALSDENATVRLKAVELLLKTLRIEDAPPIPPHAETPEEIETRWVRERAQLDHAKMTASWAI